MTLQEALETAKQISLHPEWGIVEQIRMHSPAVDMGSYLVVVRPEEGPLIQVGPEEVTNLEGYFVEEDPIPVEEEPTSTEEEPVDA